MSCRGVWVRSEDQLVLFRSDACLPRVTACRIWEMRDLDEIRGYWRNCYAEWLHLSAVLAQRVDLRCAVDRLASQPGTTAEAWAVSLSIRQILSVCLTCQAREIQPKAPSTTTTTTSTVDPEPLQHGSVMSQPGLMSRSKALFRGLQGDGSNQAPELVLYYILYCVIYFPILKLYCIVLDYIALYFILYYLVLYYIKLYYIILYYIILYYIILYYIILYYIILYYMIFYYMIWYDIIWYDMIWCNIILYYIVIIWYGMIWYYNYNYT